MRPAHVRAFGPIEAEPAQVVEGRRRILRPAAVAVEILDPHHEAGPGRAFGGAGERQRVPDVEEAGRRGGEAAAEGHRHNNHQFPVATTYAPRARFVAACARITSIGRRVAAAIPLITANQHTAASASAGCVATA